MTDTEQILRDALEEILLMATEHMAFDREIFDARDVEAACEEGGDTCEWTLVAMQAQNALDGKPAP